MSDHYPLILTFSDIPTNKNGSRKINKSQVIWNTNKEGGWECYKALTDINNEIEDIFHNQVYDIDSAMKSFEDAMDKIKDKSFGKIRFSKKDQPNEVTKLYNEKAKLLNDSSDNSDEKIEEIEEQIKQLILDKDRDKSQQQPLSLKAVLSESKRINKKL